MEMLAMLGMLQLTQLFLSWDIFTQIIEKYQHD